MALLSHPQPLGISRYLLLLACAVQCCSAAITVYNQLPLAEATASASTTGSADASAYTGLAAYNPVTLTAPAAPGASALPTTFTIPMSKTTAQGASIAQSGGFFGFSVEMSVANQVLGKNSWTLQVPFLNLMANLVSRGGHVQVRVGGNTQETATLVSNTTDGKILEKDKSAVSNPTDTPPLVFTPDLLYMMGNISALVNVRWHLGVPFNDTNNLRLAIVEQGEAILGDHLIGMQAGNEPDLYGKHGHRNPDYAPADYFGEFGTMVNGINADANIPVKNLLIGPSISSSQADWTPEAVWNTGFIDAYSSSLFALSVEHYPSDNCAVAFPNAGLGTPHDPQELFSQYLSHSSATGNIAQYLNSTMVAQQKGKPFYMFETNTASCGGFPGLSDSFGAALWGLDWAMYMAAVNFTGALFHIGGQSVAYNPFTPPPTNQSTFHEWTVGPIYYSSLVMAEAMGPTNTTQVLDMNANNGNPLSPAYAIWENGQLARVLLINFASDSTGASDLSVDLSYADGTAMPSTVNVKYLSAAGGVAQKGNIMWANQTFGGNFGSDGRPQGTESVQSVTCGANAGGANVCTIKVPAPCAALVFLNTGATPDTAGAPATTFATTAITKSRNTLQSLPSSVIAVSNGHSGSDGILGKLGSTSQGSIPKSGAQTSMVRVGGALVTVVGLLAGWAVFAAF